MTAAGALARRVAKQLASTVTPTGTLERLKVRLLTLASSVTPAGTLLRRAATRLAGTVTGMAVLTKHATKRLTGALTPTGTIGRIATRLLALAARSRWPEPWRNSRSRSAPT